MWLPMFFNKLPGFFNRIPLRIPTIGMVVSRHKYGATNSPMIAQMMPNTAPAITSRG